MPARILAATLVLAIPTVLAAQTGAGALPRAFAGYSQPAITASMCGRVNAGESQCVIPAMTAGRYLIEAAGTSTAQGADARQGLEIVIGDTSCGIARPANPAPWTSGPRTFRIDCEVTLIADSPITVRAIYGDVHAVKDPKGPSLSILPMAWQGVLGARMFAPAPAPAPAAQPTEKK